MKRHLNIPMAIIVLATILTAGAKAQTSSQQRVVANIPFAFTAGKANLPAGKYVFTVLNSTSDQKILQIRNLKGDSTATLYTRSVNAKVADNAKLVFERYGDSYYFAQAQLPGDATGLATMRSKAERKQMLALAAKKSVVVIAAD